MRAVSATKAALRSLTGTLATKLLPRQIRVNAVSPGAIETPLFGKLGLPEETVQEIGKSLLQQMRKLRRLWLFWHRTTPPTLQEWNSQLMADVLSFEEQMLE